MSYNPNIPTASDLLSVSQSDIQTNFSQLNTVFGVDHVPLSPSVADSGKHKKVTLPQQGSDPSTGALEGAIYTKDISGTMQLVYRDQSDGTITQLVPASDYSGNNGTVLLGAIRINFGSILVSSGGGIGTANVVFNTAFSSTPYSITCEPTSQGGSGTDNHWVSSPSTTGCTINQQGSGSIAARTFYYTAIGPA